MWWSLIYTLSTINSTYYLHVRCLPDENLIRMVMMNTVLHYIRETSKNIREISKKLCEDSILQITFPTSISDRG